MFNDILVLRKEARQQRPLHISVESLDEYWDNYVPVTVLYKLPSGTKRLMTARYIREMKAIGVLPR